MKTILSGDITIYDPSDEVSAWIEDELTMTNPVYVNLIRRNQMETIQKRHVQQKIKCFTKKQNALIVPFGCLRGLWPLISKEPYELNFAEEHRTDFGYMPCAVDLFGYQADAVTKMVEAKGGLLKAGCGSGKTYMGIEILRRLGLRFLWLCGKSDLLNQTKENFEKLYPDIKLGLTTEGQVDFGADGTISTVQTLVNVDYRLYQDEFNVVVVDECHNITQNPATRQMYAKVLARCKARYKYGLTATPSRQDGLTKLIYANIGMSPKGTFRPTHEIKDSDTQSLRAEYQTFELPTPRSREYLTADGSIDFNALLEYLWTNQERNMLMCRKVAELVNQEHRKVAILTYRKDHAYVLGDELSKLGIRNGVITGGTKKKDRKEILKAPDEWDVVVSTVHLFKEGLDIKALDTVFIALPFKDPTGIQQSEGRAERPMDGKNDPIFIFAYDVDIPYCESVEKKMRRIVNRRRK